MYQQTRYDHPNISTLTIDKYKHAVDQPHLRKNRYSSNVMEYWQQYAKERRLDFQKIHNHSRAAYIVATQWPPPANKIATYCQMCHNISNTGNYTTNKYGYEVDQLYIWTLWLNASNPTSNARVNPPVIFSQLYVCCCVFSFHWFWG